MSALTDRLRMRWFEEHRAPEWLPTTDGLVYYDTLSEQRTQAPTGQLYTMGDDGYEFTTVSGRKCMRKFKVSSELSAVVFPFAVNGLAELTFGCCGLLLATTGFNEQIFNIYLSIGGLKRPMMLSMHNTGSRTSINLGYWNGNSTQYPCNSGIVAVKSTWYNVIGVVNKDNWSIYVDGIYKAKTNHALDLSKVDSAAIGIVTVQDSCIRNAFIYNRALTQDEITHIATKSS